MLLNHIYEIHMLPEFDGNCSCGTRAGSSAPKTPGPPLAPAAEDNNNDEEDDIDDIAEDDEIQGDITGLVQFVRHL